jgi:parallel beta-helix repeat protein
VYYGAPTIQSNIVSFTWGANVTYCGPSTASGILLYGQGTQYGLGSVQLLGNSISNNSGQGIYLWIAGTPLVENNIIRANQSTGILIQNDGAPLIIQNLILTNHGPSYGGGLDLEISNGAYRRTHTIVSGNTIVGNTVSSTGSGSGIYVSGFYDYVIVENNVVIGTGSGAAVDCDATYLPGGPAPAVSYNDVLSTSGSDYSGGCSGDTGQSGNISTDSIFVSTGNFRLKGGLPRSTQAATLPRNCQAHRSLRQSSNRQRKRWPERHRGHGCISEESEFWHAGCGEYHYKNCHPDERTEQGSQRIFRDGSNRIYGERMRNERGGV